jgi:pilus assembly protein CpaB
MRLGRILLIVALVLVLGIGAVVVALNFMGGLGGPSQAELDAAATATQQYIESTQVRVLVLLRPLERGGQITEDLLGEMVYRRDLLPAETRVFTLEDKQEVIGKYAKYDLEKNLYLTEDMISEISVGSEYAQQIEAGKVAVSIPVDRMSLVSYSIRAGDRVDVIGTMMFVDLDSEFQTILPNETAAVIAPGPSLLLEGQLEANPNITNRTAQIGAGGDSSSRGRAELDPVLNEPIYLVPSEDQRPRLVSQMLLQNVLVLYVGEFPLPWEEAKAKETPTPPPEEGEGQGQGEGQQQQEAPAPPPPPDVITMVVSPQEAVILNYLMYSGAKLNLALRSTSDVQSELWFTDAVTLSYLMNLYTIPVPSKLDYGLEPRVDFVPTEVPEETTQ